MDIVKRLIEIPKGENVAITEALSIAKGIEERAKEFYSKNAGKTNDAELKRAFEFLAKEEQGHLEIVNAAESALKEQGKFTVIDEKILQHVERPEIYPEKGAEAKKSWDKDELTALLWAMRAERKAELFYRAHAKKAQRGEVKGFFNALAEFEIEHFQFLDGIFSTWTSTDDFILG